MFKKEHNNPVYYPRCKTVWRYSYGQIHKAKIYGHWYHRNKFFYVYEEHVRLDRRPKRKKVWYRVNPSHFDTDINFLVDIAINKKQEELKKAISETEDWIKNLPNLIKSKEQKIADLKTAIKLVSKEKFHWKTYRLKDRLNGTEEVRPLSIDKRVQTSTFAF